MRTLSGYISGSIDQKWQCKWIKVCFYFECTVWVIQIFPLRFVSLSFRVCFFCCHPHVEFFFSASSSSVMCSSGVSDSFREARVYPYSISPQHAVVLCQESFTLQKMCNYTWGIIWVWLDLSVTAVQAYPCCLSIS